MRSITLHIYSILPVRWNGFMFSSVKHECRESLFPLKHTDILNRVTNARVSMETDAEKKRHSTSFFFFCLMEIYTLSEYRHRVVVQ